MKRSDRWSTVLLVLGAVVLFLSSLVGFVNGSVVNGQDFAQIANDVRQDEAVKEQAGALISTAIIDAQPDLIAIEPALDAVAAALVGSPFLDRVFTPAVAQFHGALTEQGGGSAVLAIADLGATVTTALERFVPQAAALIPEDLNVTLAEVGGQGGIAARIIPAISAISTLAWVLPLVALGLVVAGLWLAPRRRVALVRLGWMVMVVGGALGLLVLLMVAASLLVDTSTLSGAVASAALREFSQPLGVTFIATVVVGGLLVAAAGALLPQVDLRQHVHDAATWVLRRPSSPAWALLRALAIIAAGGLIILNPTLSMQLAAVMAGLVVLFYGIAELDRMAEESRASDEAERAAAAALAGPEAVRPRRSPAGWLVPVGAASVGVLVLVALIVPQHLPQDDQVEVAAVDTEACNGQVELCDVPFDRVVIPATHNSMSVADGTWFLAEQPKDMVDSLDDGIRGLLVDTWYAAPTQDGGAITGAKSLAGAEAELMATYGPEVVASVRRTIDRVRRGEPVGPEVPYFCHTVCEIGSEPMLPVMQRLNSWLDQNPREVVVLFIQDMVSPADTASLLQEAGLADRAYVHPAGADWPTLREMIEADRRLVVLMENTGGGAEFPYLHQGFDLVQDTEYTFKSAEDFTCTLKRGRPDSPLLSVNHWLASFTSLVSSAEKVNTYDMLKARVDECEQVRGRIPSMIAVNWYDRGDLLRLVGELNRRVAEEFSLGGQPAPSPTAG